MKQSIEGFIEREFAVASSNVVEKIEEGIKKAILAYKEDGGLNHDAFSINISYDEEDKEFSFECDFKENYNMTVFYFDTSEDKKLEELREEVQNIYDLSEESEELIRKVATTMLSQNFIKNYTFDN